MSEQRIERAAAAVPPAGVAARGDDEERRADRHGGGRRAQRLPAAPPGLPGPLAAQVPGAGGSSALAPRSGSAGGRARFAQAVDQVAEWMQLAKWYAQLAPHHRETFAGQAMEAAREGLAAWDGLPADSRRKTAMVSGHTTLLRGRAEAALAWLDVATHSDELHVFEAFGEKLNGLGEHDIQGRRQLRAEIGSTITRLEEERRHKFQAAHEALVEAQSTGRAAAPAGLDKSIALLAFRKQDHAGAILHLCAVRVAAHDLSNDIAQAYMAFHTDLVTSKGLLCEARSTLLDDKQDAARRAEAAATIRRTSERFTALAENLCLVVAQHHHTRRDASDLWEDTLASANAISSFLVPLLGLADSAPATAASSSSATVPGGQASGTDEWVIAWPGAAPRPGQPAPKGRRARARARARTDPQASAGNPLAQPPLQALETAEPLADTPHTVPAEPLPPRLDIEAADAIKRGRFPEAWDLERLLDMGQIGHVTPPRRLSSHGDQPHQDLGRLFEMEIRPRPLSDGTPADPLYLHLHTDDLIDPPACHGRPYRGFAAVHVKTEAQRSLGATWEQAQRALGNLKAKVHRARVGEEFLMGLRALVTVPRVARQREAV
jgi:hypothetical protein